MALAIQPGARAQSYTTVQFSNATGSSVDAWMGVQPASAGRIGQARLIDIVTQQQVPFSDVTPDGLLGKFTLQANQTVSFDSFSGGATHGGAITFRAPPQSCPVIPGAPCGVTKGEFTINTGNESADVSSVDGINAIVEMDLTNGGSGPAWPTNPTTGSAVTRNSGTLTGDKPLWGVFPYRCTICADIGAAPPTDCNPLGPAQRSYCKEGTETNPSPAKCQGDRVGSGGIVKFTFIEAKDPLGESGPPAASPGTTTTSTEAATPSPAVTTPSALVTPSTAVTPSGVPTAQLPPTPPATAALPTAQAQPTTAVLVPTAGP
jgi:hypothetical protein